MHGDIHIAGPLIKRRAADPSVVWGCAVHFKRQAGGRVCFGTGAGPCHAGLETQSSSKRGELEVYLKLRNTHKKMEDTAKLNLESEIAISGRHERHKRFAHRQGAPTAELWAPSHPVLE